jgi:hypothetical protein
LVRHRLAILIQVSPKTNTRIDIVYLWVNGNDGAWRAKREKHARDLESSGHETVAKFGNVEGRYRDNDELRFSLRALEKFFPEHGHIYIVTDGQVPAWFQASSAVTLVDHGQLIPKAALPTFDSSNIESYIHHIPGLSERYFYLNDDVFFGAPVCLDDWFFDAGFYVSWSDEPEVLGNQLELESTSLENASRLSKQWLQAKANQVDRSLAVKREDAITRWPDPRYRHTSRTFSHSPRPMLKSVLMEVERDAPELFAQVRSTVFRTWNKPTIISDFVLRWALAHGFAKTVEHSHLYIATGHSQETRSLQELKNLFGKLHFFCINDTTDDAHDGDPRLLEVRQTLSELLPHPSRCESANNLVQS